MTHDFLMASSGIVKFMLIYAYKNIKICLNLVNITSNHRRPSFSLKYCKSFNGQNEIDFSIFFSKHMTQFLPNFSVSFGPSTCGKS